MRFQQAIVRQPAVSLVRGLTCAGLGQPDYDKAMLQHQHYVAALQACGVEVTILPADEAFPDSCFIEDPVLLTEQFALLTRPGAPSRLGEVEINRAAIRSFYRENIREIQAPGTLDAGDVLRVEQHFFIGLSARTNQEGARQAIHFLEQAGYSASTVPLQDVLHLKTGLSYLDQGRLLVCGEFVDHPAFAHLEQQIVEPGESYASNCILVNGTVLLASGFPATSALLRRLGYALIELDMSEFRKLDGGLSCLSLRF